MTSCQRLVPADLEANHLAKWIPPPNKRRHPFFLESLPVMPTSDASTHSLIHLALDQTLILTGSCFALPVNLLCYFFGGGCVLWTQKRCCGETECCWWTVTLPGYQKRSFVKNEKGGAQRRVEVEILVSKLQLIWWARLLFLSPDLIYDIIFFSVKLFFSFSCQVEVFVFKILTVSIQAWIRACGAISKDKLCRIFFYSHFQLILLILFDFNE